MTNGTPPQPNAAGGNTWYGGAPPQTPGSSPAWGPTPGFGPAQPGAAFAPPMQPTGYTSTETLLAGLAHLSSLFAPLIAPLLIWLLTRDTMPYASRQGKQAFFFHLILSAISLVFVIISIPLFFFGFAGVGLAATTNNPGAAFAFPLSFLLFFGVITLIGLASQGFAIYGAVQAFQGKPFSYPFLSRL